MVVDKIQVTDQDGYENPHDIGADSKNVQYTKNDENQTVENKISSLDGHVAKKVTTDATGVHGFRVSSEQVNDGELKLQYLNGNEQLNAASGTGDMAASYYTTPSGGDNIIRPDRGGTGNKTGYVQKGRKANSPIGRGATAEGDSTVASGDQSHAEGIETEAIGAGAHAEGAYVRATGDAAHAEGDSTRAVGDQSHAEGMSSEARERYSHAEGQQTIAAGSASHAEGQGSTSASQAGHSEGGFSQSIGDYSHAEGVNTLAIGDYSHASGRRTAAIGISSHSEGSSSNTMDPSNLPAAGSYQNGYGFARGNSSHSEGQDCQAEGTASHAEGYQTYAKGTNSHAEGEICKAEGHGSHAEGGLCNAVGEFSHAGGRHNDAIGDFSFVHGENNIAYPEHSFVIGEHNTLGNSQIAYGEGTFLGGARLTTAASDSFIYGFGNGSVDESDYPALYGGMKQFTFANYEHGKFGKNKTGKVFSLTTELGPGSVNGGYYYEVDSDDSTRSSSIIFSENCAIYFATVALYKSTGAAQYETHSLNYTIVSGLGAGGANLVITPLNTDANIQSSDFSLTSTGGDAVQQSVGANHYAIIQIIRLA